MKDIERLQAALGKLQADWTESERVRQELANALTSLQASLQSCKEEAAEKARRARFYGLVVGVGMMVIIWVTIKVINK